MSQSSTMRPEEFPRYTAGIAYDAEKIKRLTKMQYNTFSMGRKILQVLLSLFLIAAGLLFGRNVLAILSLALGCYLLVSLDYRPRTVADAIIKQFRGAYPSLQYIFSDEGIRTDQQAGSTPYRKIIMLIDDTEYFYLYLNKATAFMVDQSTVKGSGALDGFKTYLAARTGLDWIAPPSLFNLDGKKLKRLISACLQKDSDTFEGIRLKDRRR